MKKIAKTKVVIAIFSAVVSYYIGGRLGGAIGEVISIIGPVLAVLWGSKETISSLYVPLLCDACGEYLREIDSGVDEGGRLFECPNYKGMVTDGMIMHTNVIIHARNNPLYYLRTKEAIRRGMEK